MTKRNRQSGATLVEASLSVGIMVFLLLGTIDLINMFRYASVAYSVAITTARYGAVPAPNITEPDEEKLFLPQDSGDPPYLVAWRDHEWLSHGQSGTGPPMAPQVLRALNLGLGLASDIFGSKAKLLARATLFFIPPLISDGYSFAQFFGSPTISRFVYAIFSIKSFGKFVYSFNITAIFSITVKKENKAPN